MKSLCLLLSLVTLIFLSACASVQQSQPAHSQLAWPHDEVLRQKEEHDREYGPGAEAARKWSREQGAR